MSESPRSEKSSRAPFGAVRFATIASQFEDSWQRALQVGPPPNLEALIAGVDESRLATLPPTSLAIDQYYGRLLSGDEVALKAAGDGAPASGSTTTTIDHPAGSGDGPERADNVGEQDGLPYFLAGFLGRRFSLARSATLRVLWS